MTDTNKTWNTSGPGDAGGVADQIEQARLEGTNSERIAYERGQNDAVQRLTAPRMTGWRITCGICWALWTLLFGIGALVSLAHASFGSFLLAGVLAGLAGWYDYRIWTLKARRLTLFIIF